MTLTKWFPIIITLFSVCFGLFPATSYSNQDAIKLRTEASAQSCRADGFFCSNDFECCGFCTNGICANGPSNGGGTCRPDGAACSNSSECCGFCTSGICGNGPGNGGTCRPAGLACNNSSECCNFCQSGVCN